MPTDNKLSLIYEISMEGRAALMKERERRRLTGEPPMTPEEIKKVSFHIPHDGRLHCFYECTFTSLEKTPEGHFNFRDINKTNHIERQLYFTYRPGAEDIKAVEGRKIIMNTIADANAFHYLPTYYMALKIDDPDREESYKFYFYRENQTQTHKLEPGGFAIFDGLVVQKWPELPDIVGSYNHIGVFSGIAWVGSRQISSISVEVPPVFRDFYNAYKLAIITSDEPEIANYIDKAGGRQCIYGDQLDFAKKVFAADPMFFMYHNP